MIKNNNENFKIYRDEDYTYRLATMEQLAKYLANNTGNDYEVALMEPVGNDDDGDAHNLWGYLIIPKSLGATKVISAYNENGDLFFEITQNDGKTINSNIDNIDFPYVWVWYTDIIENSLGEIGFCEDGIINGVLHISNFDFDAKYDTLEKCLQLYNDLIAL